MFENIFCSSNDALNKSLNFQQCYNLQYVIDGANDLNLFQGNRFLIKQGPIYKVSKRRGETQLRHLSLVSNSLICYFFKFQNNQFENF